MDTLDIESLIQSLQSNDQKLISVSLDDSYLGQDELVKILKALKENTHVEELRLRKNFLGYEGTKTLCQLISENKFIRAVDIRNNALSPSDLHEIVKTLNSNFTLLEFKVDEFLGEESPFIVFLKDQTQKDETDWTTFTKRDMDKLKSKVQEIIFINKQIDRCLEEKSSELKLRYRNIEHVPQTILVPHLRVLDIRNNIITSLPASGLDKLSGLEVLDLYNNKLEMLPRDIGSLRNLRVLNVSKNRIKGLPGSMSLMVNLREFFLANNEISELPVVLGALALERVDTEGNPFMKQLPIDITPENLIEYFTEEFKTTGLRDTARMKLLLLGRENVGKTTLMKLLKGTRKEIGRRFYVSALLNRFGVNIGRNESNEATNTSGIEFTEFATKDTALMPKGTSLHFIGCDFNQGENIHFATYEFFLCKQSIYVIAFNLLHPEEEKSFIEYWLRIIHERAPDSPIIIVGTHNDDKRCTKEYVDNVFREILGRTQAQTRYPNLQFLYDTSTITGTNIRAIRKKISEIAAQQPHALKKVPESFLNLEEKINALLEAQPVPPTLKFESFVQVALGSDVEEKNIKPAIEHLSKVGTVLYKESFGELIILDTRWLVDAFIALEDSKDLLVRPGVLKKKKLKEIWVEPLFPKDHHHLLLKAFEEYQAVYHLEKSDLLFWPWLLAQEPPENFSTCWIDDRKITEQVRYYTFENMPSHLFSIISLLFLNNDEWIIQCHWMNGIVMEDVRNTAHIYVGINLETSALVLRIRGDQQVLKMVALDEAIDTIVTDSLRIPYEVQIPCRHCIQDERITTHHIFTQTELEDAVKESKVFVSCLGGNKPKAVRLEWLVPDIAMTTFSGEKIEFKDLELQENIGEGGYASVFKGLLNNEKVAVKQIKLVNIVNKNDNIFSDFRREVQLMSGLQNENLVVLKAICMEPFCMVLEFMEKGSLYDFVRSETWSQLDWPSRIYLAYDIARGMSFLHGMMPPIVHRDLKSPNILLTECSKKNRLRAKVADFGLSKSLRFTSKLDGKALEGHNPVWLAPEILLQKNYNEKVDVYSFGIILYEMITSKGYFDEHSFMSDVERMVIEGNRPDIPQIEEPFGIAESFIALVKECWDNDPAIRPSFYQIKSRLEEMLQKCNMEVEADEIKEIPKDIIANNRNTSKDKVVDKDILSRYKDTQSEDLTDDTMGTTSDDELSNVTQQEVPVIVQNDVPIIVQNVTPRDSPQETSKRSMKKKSKSSKG